MSKTKRKTQEPVVDEKKGASLINRYRPKSFKQVVGQDQTIRSLRKVLDKNQCHGFMFVGPSGTGKTTIARIAAKRVGADATELIEIDAATNTGVEDVRELCKGLQYASFSSGSKAVIMDECHALSGNAWRALLKWIEEPPPNVYWFFCTTEPTKVPNNIRTRCAYFELKPIVRSDMFEYVSDIANLENMDIDDTIIDLIVKESGGSPRQALVNLAVLDGVKSRKEAAELLRSAVDSSEAIDLCRVLIKGASWSEAREILATMRDTNPESVRLVVVAYMTSVILSEKNKSPERALAILEQFSQPFNYNDKISPVVLAVGRLILSA